MRFTVTRWILNASPLMILGRIEQLSLVSALCEEMIIPRKVADEVLGAARKCARALGIRHLGNIGVILRAKRQKLISKAAPLLKALLAHGFRIAQSVLTKALELAGES